MLVNNLNFMKLINNNFFLNLLFVFFLISLPATSEEKKKIENDHEYNFYLGMFDFSDDNARAATYGLEHKNDSLYRESTLGTLTPVTGGFITKDMAAYIYTGVQFDYKIGKFNFNPSFAPGLYYKGDGKDLQSPVEFKTELQLSMPLKDDGKFAFSYNHISNAGLGTNNPGANSYWLNFLKKF